MNNNKKKGFVYAILLSVFSMLAVPELNAQVTIGSEDTGNAMLDVRSTDPAKPTLADGMLVPVISNFPVESPPSTKEETGNLVFFRKSADTKSEFTSKSDGFYYWNGNEWVLLITRNSAELREQIYCAYGQGFGDIASPYTALNQVLFSHLTYNNVGELPEDSFSLADNALTVGKSGSYLVSLAVTFTRGPQGTCENQTNFSAEVLVNGVAATPVPIKAITNTSSEPQSGSQILISTIATLQKGDKLTAWVQQSETTTPRCNYPYYAAGVNSITLYYLHK